ncbi:MAG: RimK family alpha-L-glutamate ligase [Gemmatales bacterium]|nr:RimK family alpha-L-glutamate ligase [Gemmatales bacterium]
MRRLTLLASGQGWHVRDLQRAAALLGWEVVWEDFRRLNAGVFGSRERLPQTDLVLVRTMPPGSLEQVVFRMDVLHRWVRNGVAVFNSPRALEISIDKYHTTARLVAAGLTVPDTWVGQDAESALAAFEQLGGDVVVKPIFGSEGRGIFRLTERELAWRVLMTLERMGAVLYLQKYVAHEGYDVRAFVLGDEVLAGMRRYVRDGLRSNVAQGGEAEAVVLGAEEVAAALRAARAVEAEIAGVDLLPGRDGRLYVLEVNAVPGWRALTRVTGCDVAWEVLRYLDRRTR